MSVTKDKNSKLPEGIRKKGDRYYYRYYDENGVQKEKAGGKTLKEAKAARTAAIARVQSGQIDPSTQTLGLYMLWWVDEYIKDSESSPGTYRRYRDIINTHIMLNPINKVRLCDLKVLDIEKWIKQLKTTHVRLKPKKDGTPNFSDKYLSQTSIQGIYGVLRTALAKAVKLQLINDTPCKFVDTPKRIKFKPELITIDEYKQTIAYLNENKYEDYVMICALYAAAEYGERRGELCGLDWNTSFNWENKTLTFDKALIRIDNKFEISSLKTESSYRTLPMSDDFISMLKKLKRMQLENKLKYGEHYLKNIFNKKEYNLVFVGSNGKFIVPSSFLQRFKRLCKYQGIEKNVRWHDLRHFSATLLLEQKVDIKTISDRLGHSLTSTTSDLYAHVTNELKRDATDKLASILKAK